MGLWLRIKVKRVEKLDTPSVFTGSKVNLPGFRAGLSGFKVLGLILYFKRTFSGSEGRRARVNLNPEPILGLDGFGFSQRTRPMGVSKNAGSRSEGPSGDDPN